MAEGGQTFFPKGVTANQGSLLWQITDANAPRSLDTAAGWLFQADQDAQKSSFSDAIRPDDGNPGALGNAEREIQKDVVRAKGFREVRSGDERNKLYFTPQREG